MNNESPKTNEDGQSSEDSNYRNRNIFKEHDIWLSRFSGSLGGFVLVSFSILYPIINTWMANTREIQILQIKNTAEQVAYITKQREDSEREKEAYKKEMMECQKELKELRSK